METISKVQERLRQLKFGVVVFFNAVICCFPEKGQEVKRSLQRLAAAVEKLKFHSKYKLQFLKTEVKF